MRPENSTIDGVPRPRLRTKTISYGAVVVMNHARTIAPSLPPSSPANQSCKSVRSRNKNGAQWIGLLGLLSTSPSVRCHAVSHFNINISSLSASHSCFLVHHEEWRWEREKIKFWRAPTYTDCACRTQYKTFSNEKSCFLERRFPALDLVQDIFDLEKSRFLRI